MLKENGDCFHCCGDHKPDNCGKKDRKCGGEKGKKGCSKDHKVHELFCKDAKLCFTIVDVNSSSATREDGVVLSIMKVRVQKYTASVFWDLGSTSNFIREQFAEMCKFKGTREYLSVRTLGNVETEYKTVILYTCFMKDQKGEVREFKAWGMESVTGDVTQISMEKIMKIFLFP